MDRWSATDTCQLRTPPLRRSVGSFWAVICRLPFSGCVRAWGFSGLGGMAVPQPCAAFRCCEIFYIFLYIFFVSVLRDSWQRGLMFFSVWAPVLQGLHGRKYMVAGWPCWFRSVRKRCFLSFRVSAQPSYVPLVSGFGARTEVFRVSSFVFRVSGRGFRFRVLGFKVSNGRFEVSNCVV